MGRGQDPGEFDHGDQGHEAGGIDRQRLDQLGRTGRLLRIVLHDVARQHIGVETGHFAALPEAAIAAFIALIDRVAVCFICMIKPEKQGGVYIDNLHAMPGPQGSGAGTGDAGRGVREDTRRGAVLQTRNAAWISSARRVNDAIHPPRAISETSARSCVNALTTWNHHEALQRSHTAPEPAAVAVARADRGDRGARQSQRGRSCPLTTSIAAPRGKNQQGKVWHLISVPALNPSAGHELKPSSDTQQFSVCIGLALAALGAASLRGANTRLAEFLRKITTRRRYRQPKPKA